MLFAPDAAVDIDDVHLDARDVIHIALRSAHPSADCSACGLPARRVHSAYRRSLADLAWRGFPVHLALRVRRFRCASASCPRALFAERFGDLVAPYARRTTRLTKTLTRVGMALGGEAGARLLPHLGTSTSADTVLRLVRHVRPPSAHTPRVLGVDDWALRRGHIYGTLLVDLEKHCIVDVLPDREAESFAQWLREHPGVEIITRDRAEVYAQGALQGAPLAIQVADRWHLHKNVGDLLERFLQAHRAALAEAAAAVSLATPAPPRSTLDVGSSPAPVPTAVLVPLPVEIAAPVPAPESPTQTPATGRQAARQALYDQVRTLRALGLSHRAIGLRVKATPPTVRKYLNAASCPTRAPRRTKVGTLTRFDSHLRARWEQGCEDALVLWGELQAMGFRGSLRTIQRHVAGWRSCSRQAVTERAAAATVARPPSPRQARWWLLLPTERLSEDQRRFVTQITATSAPIREAQRLALDFGRLLRSKNPSGLMPWLDEASKSELAPFRDFAAGLRREQASIEAAIGQPWSNGQTEGQVTKVKMLKRQMYGRAGVPLLRQRLLDAA